MKLDDVLNLKPEQFDRKEFLDGLKREYPLASGVLKSLLCDLIEQYLANRPALIKQGSTATYNNGQTAGVSSPHKVAIDLTRQIQKAIGELVKTGAVQATDEKTKIADLKRGWLDEPARTTMAKPSRKKAVN